MANAWWVRHKKRLGYELKKLKEAGYSYSLQKEWFANGGSGLIHLKQEKGFFAGLELRVFFPDTYPFTRFEVVAPELNLKFHQNHFTKALCLLGRSPENWYSEDTIASVLAKQLESAIHAGQSDDENAVAHIEDDQAEPFSEMYENPANCIILNDSSIEIPEDTLHGTMHVALKGTLEKGFTGIILELYNEKGQSIAQANPVLLENHSRTLGFKTTIDGRWIRTSRPILKSNPEEFFREAHSHLPSKMRVLKKKKFRGMFVEILAVNFPEDVSRRQKGWGWSYCVRVFRNKNAKGFHPNYALIRPGYIGHEDIMARTSFLVGMKNKTVALFGLGCLGAPSAIELAKCGLNRLRIIDFDFVDPGTFPRWPLGLSVVGKLKSEAIADFIEVNYP